MERWRIQGLPKFFGYPLLSQERVKLRTSNFVRTFIKSIGTKAHENVGNSGRGRSQAVPKIFSAPICRAHCAVIFAIAQLSCFLNPATIQCRAVRAVVNKDYHSVRVLYLQMKTIRRRQHQLALLFSTDAQYVALPNAVWPEACCSSSVRPCVRACVPKQC